MKQNPHAQHDVQALQDEKRVLLDRQVAETKAVFRAGKSPDAPLRGEVVPRRGKDDHRQQHQGHRRHFPLRPRLGPAGEKKDGQKRQVENQVKTEIGHGWGEDKR